MATIVTSTAAHDGSHRMVVREAWPRTAATDQRVRRAARKAARPGDVQGVSIDAVHLEQGEVERGYSLFVGAGTRSLLFDVTVSFRTEPAPPASAAAVKVGDIVTTQRGRHYVVHHDAGAASSRRGRFGISPLPGSPRGRVACRADNVRLVRTAELHRFYTLLERARVYLAREDTGSARAMLVQAVDWLSRAERRGDDGPGALVAGLEKLRRSRSEVGR